MEHAIVCQGLEKSYGDQLALRGIDLAVPAASIFGLLGPNGAGKSTTVGILSTLLRPTGGEAQVLGLDVVSQRAALRPHIGLIFQEPSLDSELTANEQLRQHARLYHLDTVREAVKRVVAMLDLGEFVDRPVRLLSGGQKRRVEIARGMLHQPKLLFLDEPTLGLDVATRAGLWRQLRKLVSELGTTLFLTTHSMEEADELCDRVAILDDGKIVRESTPQALKAELGGDVIRLQVGEMGRALEILSQIPAVSSVAQEANGPWVRITVREGGRRLPEILAALTECQVLEVSLHRPTLAHVFLHHTGHAFEADAWFEG